MKKILYFLFFLSIASCSSPGSSTSHDQSLQIISEMTTQYQRDFQNFQEDLYQKSPDEVAILRDAHSKSINEISWLYKNISDTLPKFSGKITYLDSPVVIDNLWFFPQIFSGDPAPDIGAYTEYTGSYMHVADIELSSSTIARLFFVQVSVFYSHSQTLYFIEYRWQYYFLPSISIDENESDIMDILSLQKWLIREGVHLFEESRFIDIFDQDYALPQTISYPKNGKNYTLTLKKRTNTLFSSGNLRIIQDLSYQTGRSLYIEKTGPKQWFDDEFQQLEDIRIGPASDYELYEQIDPKRKEIHQKRINQKSLFESDALFVELPDHTTALYQIEIPFLESRSPDSPIIQLRGDGGTRVLENFGYQDPQSCWVKDGTYLYVPDGRFRFEEMRVITMMSLKDPKKWNDRLPIDLTQSEVEFTYLESDLMPIGSVWSGESLLFFSDRDHPFLHALYDFGYRSQLVDTDCLTGQGAGCSEVLTFAEYVNTIPVFFWRDPFDRLVLFVGYSTMVPSTCAAKPVIYLYPTVTTPISVLLNWNKKTLISIPEYGNGWYVVAHPDGKLDIDWAQYPYLFWEDTIRYPEPTTWFVIPRSDVDGFLSEKLSFLWMNTWEISDFKEYWIPHMQDAPYYRISFLSTEDMDRSAPISISPQPDSTLRIFMDFSEHGSPLDIPEQSLVPFTRTGFSVIEWGGKKN